VASGINPSAAPHQPPALLTRGTQPASAGSCFEQQENKKLAIKAHKLKALQAREELLAEMDAHKRELLRTRRRLENFWRNRRS
jgi:hypothetical protein